VGTVERTTIGGGTTSRTRPGVRRWSAVVLLALVAVLAGCDWRGPSPTEDSFAPDGGPFAWATATVGSGHGFGGGTIYHPVEDEPRTYGGVAISPGFTGTQSSVAWLGPRLASQGFVVITIDTNSGWDLPGSRGTQLLAALDHLTGASPVAHLVDPNRLAVMGHSMGGGGALEAAKARPSLRAAVPLAGFHTDTTWPEVTVPTLVVGCQSDIVAPVNLHSEPFYNSLPAATPRAYLERAGGSHSCVTSEDRTIATSAISWLKRFVDGDTRYSPWLCPQPSVGGPISEYRSSCPYDPEPTEVEAA
jgi:dienelactone hydrolase